jgi:hypothetical protein
MESIISAGSFRKFPVTGDVSSYSLLFDKIRRLEH